MAAKAALVVKILMDADVHTRALFAVTPGAQPLEQRCIVVSVASCSPLVACMMSSTFVVGSAR